MNSHELTVTIRSWWVDISPFALRARQFLALMDQHKDSTEEQIHAREELRKALEL